MQPPLIALVLALATLSLAPSAETRAAEPEAALLHYIDKRIPIKVTSEERNQVLYEMRAFLQGMHNIHHALAKNDMKAVAVAAKPLGPMLSRIPKSMRERLPEEFQEMGIAMHEQFDLIARDAEKLRDPAHTLEQMAEALSYCAGCHDTYRFQVGRISVRK